jgi:hypothetical protein
MPVRSWNLGPVTDKPTTVEVDKLFEVPVMVNVVVVPIADELATSVSVLVPVVVVGEKEPVTPAGSPFTARFTLPLKPYFGTTVTVVFTVWPG